MATKTQVPPSSFSRVRFGFGSKHPRSRLPPESSLPENANDGDWYIPYNGPYELPPPTVPRSPNRDSWGQLLGSVLSHVGSAKSSAAGHDRSDGRMASQHGASALPSSGAFNSHPYRTNTSPEPAGTPAPAAMGSQGRGAGASAQPLRGGGRPTLITSSTTFANIDTTGGVGESPTPAQRSSPLHTSPPPNRLSLGSFLTFGGSMRKSRSDSLYASRHPSVKRPRTGTPTPGPDPLHSNRAAALSDAQPPRSHSQSPLHPDKMIDHRSRRRSHTLIGTSMAPAQPSSPSHDSSLASYYTRESPLSTHPYANTFPSQVEAPRRAPVLPPPASRPLDKGKGVDRSYMYPQPPMSDPLNNPEVPAHLKPASRTSLLKTISAPNLRNLSRGFSSSKQAPSRGKYRWLSPETWCDALLFPRPRFLAYVDDDPPPQSFSHRPTARPPEVHTTNERPRNHQMAMRASRSAVNLHAPNSESSHGPPRAEPMLMARRRPLDAGGRSSADRPRSFAQDDLAIPSPVPSLAKFVILISRIIL